MLKLTLGDINLFLEGSQGSLLWCGSILAVRKASQCLVPALALQITAGLTHMVRQLISVWFQNHFVELQAINNTCTGCSFLLVVEPGMLHPC